MGLCEVLTVVFVILKLTGFIEWSWFWVVFPEILAILVYVGIVVLAGIGMMKR